MPRKAWVAVLCLTFAPGCSLAYDFARFQTADGDAGPGHDAGEDAASDLDAGPGDDAGPRVDAFVPDGGSDIDAFVPDAGSGIDAATPDAGPGIDAFVPDAGPGIDAATPDAGRDAGSVDAGVPGACTGFRTTITIPLGAIAGLPSPIVNTSMRVVGTPASDLAIVWADTSGAAHIHAFHVDIGSSVVSDLRNTTFATGLGSGLRFSVARDGADWITLVYSPRTLTRCTDGGACTPLMPAGVVGLVGMTVGTSGVGLVHASSTSFVWRASGLSGAALDLTDQPSHGLGIDVAARDDGGYVALLNQQVTSTERVSFVWFDQPPTAAPAVAATSTITSPVNSLYVAFDAATSTAVGVASGSGTATIRLLTSAQGSTSVTQVDAWGGANPSPIVARGDGTFYVEDATGYSLRSLASPAVVIDQPGDPGAIGAPLVIAGHYAYLSIYDMVSDQMELNVYPCL